MNETASAQDRLAAAGCRLARRLFEACASGASTAAPTLAVALAPLAGMFAWHAELLYDVLPVRTGIDRDALVEACASTADDAMDLVDELAAAGDSLALCASVCLLVDWRRAQVDDERQANDPRLEGARARALQLIARDLTDACEVLESVTASLTDGTCGATGVEHVRAVLDASRPSTAANRQEGLTAPVE